MIRRYLKLLLVLILVILVMGCTINTENLPLVYVSLRDTYENNILYLQWIVENRSHCDVVPITFSNGKILNYNIRHHGSGITYTNDSKTESDKMCIRDSLRTHPYRLGGERRSRYYCHGLADFTYCHCSHSIFRFQTS